MLTIRLQRRGRKGNAHFRVIVQEHQYSPTSGKVVKYLGDFNPHTKELNLDKEAAEKYLSNGAQPSERVVKIFKKNGVKLPKWVKEPKELKRDIKDIEKLRKNQPAEEPAPEAEAPAEEVAVADEAPAEDKPAEEAAPAEEKSEEAPAEEKTEE